ncbi:MAG: zinc metallopeptidase [Erysipelotrichales bacterium]
MIAPEFYVGGFSGITLLLIIVPIILVFIVQGMLNGNYNKYSKIRNSRGLTGYQVARMILDSKGLHNVEILQGRGQLSDYFDPTKNIIKLSPDVYNGDSIASLAVAAHEVGHAIQYATKYPVIGLRNKILPLAMASQNLAWAAIFMGLIFGKGNYTLLYIGIGMLCVMMLFQVVTLPLEFNASSRALKILEEDHYLTYEEVPKAKRMLNSAAMTYVVAVITTLAQVIRLVLITQQRN